MPAADVKRRESKVGTKESGVTKIRHIDTQRIELVSRPVLVCDPIT